MRTEQATTKHIKRMAAFLNGDPHFIQALLNRNTVMLAMTGCNIAGIVAFDQHINGIWATSNEAYRALMATVTVDKVQLQQQIKNILIMNARVESRPSATVEALMRANAPETVSAPALTSSASAVYASPDLSLIASASPDLSRIAPSASAVYASPDLSLIASAPVDPMEHKNPTRQPTRL